MRSQSSFAQNDFLIGGDAQAAHESRRVE